MITSFHLPKTPNKIDRSIASLAAEFQENNIGIPSEWAGMVLIRNCKIHSSHRPSVLISHHMLNNRKRKDKHSSAWSFRPDVYTAGK